MCRSNGETVDHSLLHCGKAYRLWSLVFRSFGFSWVLPRSVADTLFGWWNWPGRHLSSIWNLAPLCLMWCLWRERNRRTWRVQMTSFWLFSVALCLTGLELGDSPLVKIEGYGFGEKWVGYLSVTWCLTLEFECHGNREGRS
uniref:Reverse transcriptase zinc-binding domain-containing protein n=1 Tax=Quercus lobata TaxID=97700 RepID=A0A7N2MMT0_QUELO